MVWERTQYKIQKNKIIDKQRGLGILRIYTTNNILYWKLLELSEEGISDGELEIKHVERKDLEENNQGSV